MLLRDAVLQTIRARFPHAPVRFPQGTEAIAVFASPHPAVGEAAIRENGDELVVMLGRFTHVHFANHDALTESAKAERIAQDVGEFLAQVFADEIAFYGNRRGGAFRARASRPRGWFSRWFFGPTTYVWSGPLGEGPPAAR